MIIGGAADRIGRDLWGGCRDSGAEWAWLFNALLD
jgi:hypothetical protein